MRAGRFVACVVAAVLFQPLLSQARSNRPEVRALWVTRWEYKTARDVETIADWAVLNGFNLLLFQVRGNGTVYFDSEVEPTDPSLGSPPRWDPLRTAVQAAHARGLKIQAWVNVFPGWRGTRPPDNPGQLYNLHPEWFLLSLDGKREFLGGDYAYLTPTLPSVQQYLTRLFQEIWRKYDVDGLHLDYFRYPGPGYGYDPVSLAIFRGLTGATPDSLLRAWDAFRRDAVTQLLRNLHAALKRDRRELSITAAVIGDYELGRSVFLQDSHQWMADGLVDAIFPMTYTSDTTRFAREVREHLLDAHRCAVIPGIMARSGYPVAQEIALSRKLGTLGFCVFSFGELRTLLEQSPVDSQLITSLLFEPAECPALVQRRMSADTRGPNIRDIRTEPDPVPTDHPWTVSARIVDPAGILVSPKNPKAPYLIWTSGDPSEGGHVVVLEPALGEQDLYRTSEALPAAPAGQAVTFRIFAADRSASEASRTNWNYSVLQRRWPVPSRSRWRRIGFFGPAIWGPGACETDRLGNLWVAETLRHQIRVFSPDGFELPFSPVRTGLNPEGRPVSLGRPSGLVIRNDTVFVAANARGTKLFRFQAATGKGLPAVKLSFSVGDLEAGPHGAFLAAAPAGSCWRLFDAAGNDLKMPVCTSHLTQGLAILADGSAVLATCRSEDVVHVWKRIGTSGFLYEEIPHDLPFRDIRIGDVETGPNGHVFLCLTGAGMVLELNTEFQVVGALRQGLRAPRTVALSPDGQRCYVVEAAGIGPERIHLFLRD